MVTAHAQSSPAIDTTGASAASQPLRQTYLHAMHAHATEIWLGFALACFTLILVGAVSYWSTIQFSEGAAWVTHTYDAIGRLQALLNLLSDGINRERGYLLTGDSVYLRGRNREQDLIESDLHGLETLLADNPVQIRRIARLRPMLANRMAMLSGAIDAARSGGERAGIDFMHAHDSYALDGAIDTTIDTMRETERQLLRERQMRLARVTVFSTRIVVYGTLAALVFVGFSGAYIALALRHLHRATSIAEQSAAEAEARGHELARSNAELEQFAYVASHDLQEPLRMVASYLQLLAQRYQGHLDADADDFIAFAVDGAMRMKQLINALLNYSRAGRDVPMTRVDLQDVVRRTLASLALTIDETHAEIAHDALPIVLGDENRLYELLQNLISNAIKFRTAERPRVHISARRTGFDWIVSVADNGIGISPEYQEQIFAMFQRLHARDEYPGTGIGLAICKRIVERLGGRIWVESEYGNGATFSFTLRGFEEASDDSERKYALGVDGDSAG